MKPRQLKEVIKSEYQKCAKEPIYFLKKYCVVQHPIKGKVPFHLWSYQEQSLKTFEDHSIEEADMIQYSNGDISYVLAMKSADSGEEFEVHFRDDGMFLARGYDL